MTRLFTNKRLIALLASLILLVLIASLTIRARAQITIPEKFVLDSFSTVQRFFYQPAMYVSNAIESLKKINQLYNENEILQQNLNNYEQLKAQVDLLQHENSQMKTALGFKQDNTGYTKLPAFVTGHSITDWNSVIEINVGSRDGVKKDMPVITTSGGLVGRVTDVADFNSKVLLITDTEKAGISAQVYNGEQSAFGVVNGSGSDSGTVKMGLIPKETPLQVGQYVYTSGLSDMFPKGLLIGKLSKLISDDTGLTQTVLIKPAADINHLEYVFVVFQSKP
ncbi:MAG: mreC [Bacilli bacterium]|nr:mreC [Bacilli bacterium]